MGREDRDRLEGNEEEWRSVPGRRRGGVYRYVQVPDPALYTQKIRREGLSEVRKVHDLRDIASRAFKSDSTAATAGNALVLEAMQENSKDSDVTESV